MRIIIDWFTWKKIFFFLLFLALIVVVFSCSPARRMAILKKNHPKLFTTDTTWIKDTLITETVKADTVFSSSVDTVVIHKNNLTVKYIHTRDSVYIYGECKGDTIIRQVPVITERITFKENLPSWVWPVIGILAVIIILLLILRK
jgi:hypothetical protein